MTTNLNINAHNPAAGWEEVDLFRFFAFAFGQPTPERFAWFSRPDLPALLESLWTLLGCPGEFPGAAPYTNYGKYESTYIAVFDVGVPRPPVPLQESAHYAAQPAQQVALENTYFYEALGLRADPARYGPDHLITQLEFLAAVRYARGNATDPKNQQNLIRLERDFCERHLLNWLPAAEKELTPQGPPVFPVLLTLLVAFLRRRHAALAYIPQSWQSTPR